jgi:WD40 repeat protein
MQDENEEACPYTQEPEGNE